MQRPPFKKQRHKSDNKIVSPVIPQPGGERKRHPSHPRHHTERPHLSQQNLQPPRSYNPKSELFQFGNYNKYYGYRNPDQTPDVRLEYLKREWFDGREVLDIGCNIGHVTLTVARDFNPKRVVGIDIDKKLVNIAQKNIKHYLRKGDAEEANFPKSMRLLYGPLRPPVQADGFRSFPHNVKFVHVSNVFLTFLLCSRAFTPITGHFFALYSNYVAELSLLLQGTFLLSTTVIYHKQDLTQSTNVTL